MRNAIRKPRIYLRKIQLRKNSLANEETMLWIWMGRNPVGRDWSLGGVPLFTLAEIIKRYKYRLKRASVLEVA